MITPLVLTNEELRQNLFAGGSTCTDDLFSPICITEDSSGSDLNLPPELIENCKNKPFVIAVFIFFPGVHVKTLLANQTMSCIFRSSKEDLKLCRR